MAKPFSFLGIPLIIHPPEQATALLLPGVCSMGNTLFAPSGHIETAHRARLNGAVVVGLVHPVADLDTTNAGYYTVAPGFDSIRL